MLTGRFNTPLPTNEPVYGYAPGSQERAELEQNSASAKPSR